MEVRSHRKVRARKSQPVGKVRQAFEEVSKLPRRQQDKIVEFVTAFVQHYQQNRQDQASNILALAAETITAAARSGSSHPPRDVRGEVGSESHGQEGVRSVKTTQSRRRFKWPVLSRPQMAAFEVITEERNLGQLMTAGAGHSSSALRPPWREGQEAKRIAVLPAWHQPVLRLLQDCLYPTWWLVQTWVFGVYDAHDLNLPTLTHTVSYFKFVV